MSDFVLKLFLLIGVFDCDGLGFLDLALQLPNGSLGFASFSLKFFKRLSKYSTCILLISAGLHQRTKSHLDAGPPNPQYYSPRPGRVCTCSYGENECFQILSFDSRTYVIDFTLSYISTNRPQRRKSSTFGDSQSQCCIFLNPGRWLATNESGTFRFRGRLVDIIYDWFSYVPKIKENGEPFLRRVPQFFQGHFRWLWVFGLHLRISGWRKLRLRWPLPAGFPSALLFLQPFWGYSTSLYLFLFLSFKPSFKFWIIYTWYDTKIFQFKFRLLRRWKVRSTYICFARTALILSYARLAWIVNFINKSRVKFIWAFELMNPEIAEK